jgi:hypothetical protein
MTLSKASHRMRSSRHISTPNQLSIAFPGGNQLLPVTPLIKSRIVSSKEKPRHPPLHAAIARCISLWCQQGGSGLAAAATGRGAVNDVRESSYLCVLLPGQMLRLCYVAFKRLILIYFYSKAFLDRINRIGLRTGANDPHLIQSIL